ncbi:MAG TPA: aspartate/glutamate racemase family protein [Gemmatimonadaceae bacterium]|nr:aspartate/glutamate racemase family protein [Gemmatimonadaceae bacterium]
MRSLGLLGGMSWESTAEYYRLLNQGVAARLGGLHSAKLLIHSVDFAEIARLQQTEQWDRAGLQLSAAAAVLERAGAEAIVLCTNTMHNVARTIERGLTIPLLHIVDPTGSAMQRAGVRRAGLLGTRYTMELPFWRERLTQRFGIDLLVPDEQARADVHRIIYDELCRGQVTDASRARYVEIINELNEAGADAVILGCTEIGLLIGEDDSPLPTFDTTRLHVCAALDFTLASMT